MMDINTIRCDKLFLYWFYDRLWSFVIIVAAGGDVFFFFFKWGRLKKKTSCFSNQVRRGWCGGAGVKVDRQGSTLVKVKERER
jgi:hypothetical protein